MLHDIIRQWQATQLYDSHKLTQLYIFRAKVSKSFDQQVLATQQWDSKKTLLVIFHDPPDLLLGPQNPIGNGESVRYELHETWLVSPLFLPSF
jgi:histone deacetylase 6